MKREVTHYFETTSLQPCAADKKSFNRLRHEVMIANMYSVQFPQVQFSSSVSPRFLSLRHNQFFEVKVKKKKGIMTPKN